MNDNSKKLAVKEKNPFELAITDKSMNSYLKSVIGEKTNEFVSNMVALVNQNPSLINIPANELINAGLQATSMDLPLEKSLGCAYVIPYKGHAQFQTGKDGYIQLALRTEKYKTINVCTIYSVEELQNKAFLYGEPYAVVQVKLNRVNKNLTKEIGYCATFVTIWGFEKSLFVTTKEMQAFCSRYSESYKNDKYGKSLWNTDFNVMAEKTVIKNLLKHYGIKTAALNKAIISDQAVIVDYQNQEFDYIDNPQNQNVIDTQAEVVEEQPEQKQETPKVDPEKKAAINRSVELKNTGVFTEQELTTFKENWKNDWKQAIADLEEAYKLKTASVEEAQVVEPEPQDNGEAPF